MNAADHCITNNSSYSCDSANCCTDEAATIRVTNLSEDTRETDLQDLFRPFGSIARIFLAKDKVTGQSKVCCVLKYMQVP